MPSIFDSNPASPIFHLLLGAVTAGQGHPVKCAFEPEETLRCFFLSVMHDGLSGTRILRRVCATAGAHGAVRVVDDKRLAMNVQAERYLESSHRARAH